MTAIFDDALIFKQPITIEGGLTQTGTSMPVLGDATGSPSYTLSKSAGGTARIDIKAASILRARFELDASENLVIANYDAAGALLGKLTFANATGLLTSLLGMVITAGGLTVSAGGATVTGGLEVTSGIVKMPLVAYADDAAAGVAGLTTGNLYLIGATVTAKT